MRCAVHGAVKWPFLFEFSDIFILPYFSLPSTPLVLVSFPWRAFACREKNPADRCINSPDSLVPQWPNIQSLFLSPIIKFILIPFFWIIEDIIRDVPIGFFSSYNMFVIIPLPDSEI